MLSFLVSWAEQLIIALIIIIMVEMIIPNNSYRKYIKIILGIFIIYTIFSPFVGNKLDNIDFAHEIQLDKNQINVENQESTIDYNKQIETVFKEKFKETLSEDMKEKGYEISNINLNVTYKEENILIDSLEFKISKLAQTDTITVEKVRIKNSTDIDKNKIEELKKQISEDYNIEISKIFIESENKND